MLKFASSLAVLCLVLSGCDMNRPPIQAPDAAWNTYQGRLAEQCSEKHLENLPPDRLNDIAKEYYSDADTQIQQLIEVDTRKQCAAGSDATACYNTGFIQATIQAGSTSTFVKQVCSKAKS